MQVKTKCQHIIYKLSYWTKQQHLLSLNAPQARSVKNQVNKQNKKQANTSRLKRSPAFNNSEYSDLANTRNISRTIATAIA